MRKERRFDGAICDGCGVTLEWLPFSLGGALYCCDACARSGNCACAAFRPYPTKSLPRRGRALVRREPCLRAGRAIEGGDEW